MIRIIEGRSFNELKECRFCNSESITYEFIPQNYGIKAICNHCGSFLGFIPQITKRSWSEDVKQMYKYRCARCGKTLKGKEAHAHHKIPKWFMPSLEFDIDNGICLCTDCHKQIHGYAGTIKEEIKEK